MSFWKGLSDSLNSIFNTSESIYASNSNSGNPNCSSTMEVGVGVGGSKVSNERTAGKLKGYYDLATEEIDKAVRAEEWGLIDDAISHYRNAQRILAEGAATRPPSFVSSSEQQKVNSYHQKISKWQVQVSERLRVLSARIGGKNTNKPAMELWML